MTSLPPYSTYRTDSKQMMFPQATSHGNILSFVPPGFKQELHVKFPDSRLAVCEKCKKNFKTRDMCRVRNAHTDAPWTDAYICVTIDESCLDEDGHYIDKPMTVRMVQWQPYCIKTSFDSKTPVCAACKRTNRTRSFCRDRHKHRHLPWCTVYVLLSSLESADPSTLVAGPSSRIDGENGDAEGKGKSGDDDYSDSKPKASEQNDASGEANATGDDINDIPESRTFLAKVSSRSMSLHWVELADFDGSEGFPGGMAPADAQHFHPAMMSSSQGMDPSSAASQYYGHGMGYAQQHQIALKSRQQYFFQMQQQQQYASQQPQWHPGPYAQGQAGHSTSPSGEGSSHQRREMSEAELHAQQQWAMYYGVAPPGAYQPPPHGHETESAPNDHQYNNHHEPESDEPDSKRQRV